MFDNKAASLPPAGRALDVRLALALRWDWHELADGLRLLCPPPDDEAGIGFFFDPDEDEYQFVPEWSTNWADAGRLLVAWSRRCTVEILYINPKGAEWICDIAGIVVNGELLPRFRGVAPTAQHAIAWAICQAAEALPKKGAWQYAPRLTLLPSTT